MQQFVYTNEGKVLLREAKEEDVPKIYDMYQDYNPHSWWESRDLNQFRYDLIKEARGKVFVAVLNGEVIGHAEIVLPDNEQDPVYLVRLEIHDDYRRRKFGIEMVRYSAIIIKNMGYEGYVTWPDVDKSKGLYKKVGLKEIERIPELSVEIKNQKEVDVKKLTELSESDRPEDMKVVIGCPWGNHYIWLKAFRAGEAEILGYQGPYAHKVEVEETEGAVLIDGKNLYIYLPNEEQENVKLIEKLIIYGSNLAFEKEMEGLTVNIRSELWEQMDLSDIWEVKAEEERLSMEMEF